MEHPSLSQSRLGSRTRSAGQQSRRPWPTPACRVSQTGFPAAPSAWWIGRPRGQGGPRRDEPGLFQLGIAAVSWPCCPVPVVSDCCPTLFLLRHHLLLLILLFLPSIFRRDSRFFSFFPLPDNRYILPFSWLFTRCAALACPASSRHSFIGRAVFLRSSTAIVPSRTKERASHLRIPAISLTTTLTRDSSPLSLRVT